MKRGALAWWEIWLLIATAVTAGSWLSDTLARMTTLAWFYGWLAD